MKHDRRHIARAIGMAAVAGLAAAGIVYVLYTRPGWRRRAAALGRMLLSAWWKAG